MSFGSREKQDGGKSIKAVILCYVILHQVILLCVYLYRVSQEECAILWESVPYVNYTDITQNTYIQS